MIYERGVILIAGWAAGLLVHAWGCALTRLWDQRVSFDFEHRLPLWARWHFLKFTTRPETQRKSLIWRCDLYHFADHMIALGFVPVGLALVAAYGLVSFWMFLAMLVLMPPVRGWFLMYWLHVGLEPIGVYRWTMKKLVYQIVFFWRAE